MTGRRLPDSPNGVGIVFAPGEYGRIAGVWVACTPNGHLGNLSAHEVVEHDDGTITVSPSILITLPQGGGHVEPTLWHGYLRRGEWSEA